MTKGARVLLASMPFGPLLSPSIALGLLSAALTRDGVDNRSRYFTIEFARRIGLDRYVAVSEGNPRSHLLFGEWLFRDALFGRSDKGAIDGYYQLLASQGCFDDGPSADRRHWKSIEAFVLDAEAIRNHVEGFLDEATAEVLEFEPTIVGFTSVFQQHVASLALAKRIKAADRSVTVVFGGANCEDVMGRELVRQFSEVDFVVSGEGDAAFPALVRALREGEPADIPGVFYRGSPGAVAPATTITDLDALPLPAYDDYFRQWADVFPRTEGQSIPFETSRGCWWGAKHHCTFCGLNGTTMAFRSKSAGRAMQELNFLASSHPDYSVSVVDNILDMRFFEDFIPALAALEKPVTLFYEVKANLTKAQVRALRDANIIEIQPGIESLHDSVLRLMKKGVSALQNLQLLKWCAELGVRPHWNLIWGFPRENPGAYEEMTRLVPQIRHLEAPAYYSPIRLDRFSPNFKEPRQNGLRDVKPFESYDIVYGSLSEAARRNLAYYFQFQYSSPQDVESYSAPLRAALGEWQRNQHEYAFFFVDKGDRIVLFDLRQLDPRILALDSVHAEIYRFCDSAKSADQITAAFATADMPEKTVREDLDRLVREGALLASQGRYLSLAVRAGTYSPSAEVRQRLLEYFRKNGEGNKEDELSLPLREFKSVAPEYAS
jgi:ribosomal peptide maturation radical SAM protein 1